MLMCRAVARRSGGETSVVDAFDSFTTLNFPSDSHPFSVWMQLRDGHGRTELELAVERLLPQDLEPALVVVVPVTLHFADPHQVQEHEARFPDGIALEDVGRYRLRLSAGGTTIMQRYFGAWRLP
jgi:hypothetical protein